MSIVIEEAKVQILPSFKDFKPTLITGLKEATEGVTAEVRVKLQVDQRFLHNSIKDAVGALTTTASTVKLRAEFDHGQMKRDFTTALGRATESAASTVAAAKVRLDVNGTYLKASLETGIREAIRSVNATTGDSVKVTVEPIIDRRKLDTQLAELSKKTVVIKVRYETENAPTTSPRALAGGNGGRPAGSGRRGGSGQSSTRLAEFINALPGIGGIGPNAARAIVTGITAGAPAIAAALGSAVALGLGATGIAAGIALAAQDNKVRNAASLLGASIMGTLTASAQPFRDELLSVLPKLGSDLQKLQPQLQGIFGALAPSLGRLETGLIGGLQGALQPQAAQNAAQFIDAAANKLPAMGQAVGQFLIAVTDPRSIKFFTGLIDVVDKLVVGLGNVVGWLGKVNAILANSGVYGAIGTVIKGLLTTVGSVANALGPGLSATVIALGAAFLLLGSRTSVAGTQAAVAGTRATTAWSQARLAVAGYFSALAGGGVGGGLIGSASTSLAGLRATNQISALAARRASLVSGGLNAAGLAAAVGGSFLSGSSPILGGALTGAGTGLLLGTQFGGPVGAAAGAAIGGGLGAFGGFSQEQQTKSDALAGSIKQLGDQFSKTGTLSTQLASALGATDKVLADLSANSGKYGVSLDQIVKAQASGDPRSFDKPIKDAEQKAKQARNSPLALLSSVLGGGLTAYAGIKYSSKDQDALVTALKKAQADVAVQAAQPDNNYSSTPPPWLGTVFEKFQQLMTGTTPSGISNPFTTSTGLNIAPEVQTVNTITDAYHSYITAQRAVGDAQYQQTQTAQQTAIANEAALHGVITAEHGLAQAHFATEMAQRSLTDARKEAIANLTELHRQVRDLGDNEESLKIKLVEANLAEQQTRGLDSDSLTRRKAILEQHSAANALKDFQADRSVLLDKARVADQRGVEGSTAVLQASNSLAESQRNELEQVRNVKLARDNYNNTLESSRRQNQLAARAVDDANIALGQQSRQLAIVEAAAKLTTDQVAALYDGSLKLDRTFALDITDNGTALIAKNGLGDLYQGLVQIAGVYGIAIPGWDSTYQVPQVAPGPGLDVGAPNRRSRAAFAMGGPVPGWSPHDRADNIPAWLTAGEYVINAASSRKHNALLDAINADRHYASGGLVLPLTNPVSKWSAPIQANINSLLGASGAAGSASAPAISSVQSWLRNDVDPLPYKFGSVGPSAYDCSGLVGEVWARLTGNPSNRRYFVTGNERQFLTSHGFKDGTGTFTIGFSNEHTMGTLGGVPFEAANERSGIHVGSGTSDVTKFPNVMYLPSFGDRFIGGGGYPPSVDKVTVGGLFGTIMRKILTEAKKNADLRGAGGDSGLADRADANVAQIAYNTARSMGADTKSLLALFEAGIVESGMRNLNYGDRDSLGFLQQRASWGSAESRQNVAESTRRFLSRAAGKSANATTAGRLAQAVQVSAFPDRYDNARSAAVALLRRLDPGIQFGTFDSGGWLRDVGFNQSGRPEAVLDPDESRAYVQHAKAVSGTGGEMRLDEWSINRLAQALSTRPIPVHMDGRKVADAVIPHIERRF